MKTELRKLLLAGLAEKGFPSASAAVASFPVTMPMVEVGDELKISAVQLGELLRLEVDPSDLKRLAARILIGEFTRFLGEVGWPSDDSEKAVMPTIHAYLTWRDILGRDLKDEIKRVFDRVRQLASAGWRPVAVDDPYLVEAFDAW